MKINYYRHPNAEGESESWENCQFDSNTDLSSLTVKHLVTINGQPFLRQHHLTYLTGGLAILTIVVAEIWGAVRK